MKLIFNNPITNQIDNLDIKDLKLDYFSWKSIINCKTDDDVIKILNTKLKELDCTKEHSYGRTIIINSFIYDTTMSNYYYYLIKLKNQFLYNDYIDKLINRHIKNIIFEYDYPYIENKNKNQNKIKKKKRPINKFVKYVTFDMFTNKEVFVYENPFTKEIIESDNPNLLDELNAPKKKERKKSIKIKEIGVPISAMTFNFKKK